MTTWDTIGASGYLLFCAGIACMYWPLALVALGTGLVIVYVLREVYTDGLPATGDDDDAEAKPPRGGRRGR